MVKINDRFYISSNSTCFTLQEKTIIQDVESKNYGKEIYKDLGYYVSLETCLEGFLKTITREMVSKDEFITLRELLIEIKNQKQLIKDLLQGD